MDETLADSSDLVQVAVLKFEMNNPRCRWAISKLILSTWEAGYITLMPVLFYVGVSASRSLRLTNIRINHKILYKYLNSVLV